MELNQLVPAEIVRDEMGTWTHLEYLKYLNEKFGDAEFVNQEDWDEMKRYFNIETVNYYLESCVSGDDWEIMMDECDISKWNPVGPDGFFLIDIHFGEDDAYAIFAREKRTYCEVA